MLIGTKGGVFVYKKLFAVLAVLLLLCGCEAEAPMISNDSFADEGQKVFPVLYYEDLDLSLVDMLRTSCHSYTYRIENGEALEIEKHGRTWSETYPLSAVDADMREKYGQLMKYYGAKEYEAFVFFKTISGQNKYTVIINDAEAELILEQNESFADFLFFDGAFHLMTLDDSDEHIYAYRFSKDAKAERAFVIDYNGAEISGIDYTSFSAGKDVLAVPAEKNGKSCIITYDFESGKTKVIDAECELFGIVAEENTFKAAGYNKKGNVVIFEISGSGEITEIAEVPHPFGKKLSPESINTPGTVYMHGSEIWINFKTDDGCFIASLDTKTGEWTNYFKIEPIEKLRGPLKVKYMAKSGEKYYDIFPGVANAE